MGLFLGLRKAPSPKSQIQRGKTILSLFLGLGIWNLVLGSFPWDFWLEIWDLGLSLLYRQTL